MIRRTRPRTRPSQTHDFAPPRLIRRARPWTLASRRKREAILRRIQQLLHERAAVAPIQEVASLTGVGPKVEQSALGLIAGYAFFSAPYEDVKLKAK